MELELQILVDYHVMLGTGPNPPQEQQVLLTAKPSRLPLKVFLFQEILRGFRSSLLGVRDKTKIRFLLFPTMPSLYRVVPIRLLIHHKMCEKEER